MKTTIISIPLCTLAGIIVGFCGATLMRNSALVGQNNLIGLPAKTVVTGETPPTELVVSSESEKRFANGYDAIMEQYVDLLVMLRLSQEKESMSTAVTSMSKLLHSQSRDVRFAGWAVVIGLWRQVALSEGELRAADFWSLMRDVHLADAIARDSSSEDKALSDVASSMRFMLRPWEY
ncbi:MAG: hypothetical protein Q8L55_06590 [Phycisphaerales bacterium]|nr:hypothetical protein [Phycisphaerales bacterium]